MTTQDWQQRNRPMRLEKRYEFACYDDLRKFLDEVADVSERNGVYPDIGFGKTYANFTIHLDVGKSDITDQQREFAATLDSLDSSNSTLS